MLASIDLLTRRREQILAAAILVFGRFGFKKASVDDLAAVAGLSKQGLYLHFPSKEAMFVAAMQKYLDDGLRQVDHELARPGAPLFRRLMGAMDAWFGRHLATFAPDSFDVIDAGRHLAGGEIERHRAAFQARLAKALADSDEFRRAGNACTPREVAQALFTCGLTWKESPASRAKFLKSMGVCVRACCQIGERRRR